MHDLRKKVLLESGKTQSKKAKLRPDSAFSSPIASPAQSPRGSRNVSRAGSRYASEDEQHTASDDDLDDSMTISTASLSDDEGTDGNKGASWIDRLQSRISQLLAARTGERKRMAAIEREDILKGYLHLVRHHYAQREVSSAGSSLLDALIKVTKQSNSPVERSLALRALSVSTLTAPTDSAFETAEPALKGVIEDDDNETIKAVAVYTLAVVATYGDGSERASQDTLRYLMDIIESDGQTANAVDSVSVAVAALRSWGFVAAHLDDLSEEFDEAMEAFVEQLDSTDASVQTSAGANIALLFENAREAEEETGKKINVKYDAKNLARQMKELSRGSKSYSKKDRRMLKSDFTSIVTALERGKGPGYSTSGWPTGNPNEGGSLAETDEGGDIVEFGYRQVVWVGNEKVLVDSWAMSANVELLRTVLAGGLSTHFSKNPIVRDMLL